MSRFPLHPILVALLMLVGIGPAVAHLGFENDVEVRVYQDRMRVVIRTSYGFAWTVLGPQAPPLADDAGRAAAAPLLARKAPDLLEIKAGGNELVAFSADCRFEPHEDVAFVLIYDRPAEWPLVVTARYFDLLTPLDTGTIAVFDQSAFPFRRDMEPLASRVVDAGNPSLTVELRSPAPEPLPPEPTAPMLVENQPEARGGSGKLAITGLALLILLLGTFAFMRLSASKR